MINVCAAQAVAIPMTLEHQVQTLREAVRQMQSKLDELELERTAKPPEAMDPGEKKTMPQRAKSFWHRACVT